MHSYWLGFLIALPLAASAEVRWLGDNMTVVKKVGCSITLRQTARDFYKMSSEFQVDLNAQQCQIVKVGDKVAQVTRDSEFDRTASEIILEKKDRHSGLITQTVITN